MGIFSELVGGAMSMANNALNAHYTKLQSQRNYEMNEKAADAADARQRAQYNDLYSVGARMQQYAQNGISPSVMLSNGGTGIGSGSAGAAQGAGNAGMAAFQGNPIFTALDAAQIENLKAQTHKTEAEAQAVEGKTPGEIKLIAAQTATEEQKATVEKANAKLAEKNARLTELLGDNQTIKNSYEAAHNVYTLLDLQAGIQREIAETIKTDWDIRFDIATFDKRVEEVKERVNGIIAQNLLLESEKELTDANKKLIDKNIQAFEQRLQNEIIQAYSTWNQAEAARVNATVAVQKFVNDCREAKIRITQKDIELLIRSSEVMGSNLSSAEVRQAIEARYQGETNFWGKNNAFKKAGQFNVMPSDKIEINVDWKKINW